MKSTLSYQIRPEQYLAALRSDQRRLLRHPKVRKARFFLFLTMAFVGFALGWTFPAAVGNNWHLYIALLAGMGALKIDQWWVRRAIVQHIAGPTRTDLTTLSWDEAGLAVSSAGSRFSTIWSAVVGVEEGREAIVLFLDPSGFILIPDQAFATTELRADFFDRIGDPKRLPLPATDETAVPDHVRKTVGGSHQECLTALVDNIKAGFRFACLMKARTGALHVSWTQFIALAVLGIANPFLADFARIGWKGSFSAYALPGAVFHLPLVIFALWAISAIGKRPQRTLDLLVAVAATSIPIDLASVFLQSAIWSEPSRWSPTWQTYLDYLPAVWLAIAASVAAIRIFEIERTRWLAVTFAAGLFIAYPLAHIEYYASLWNIPYDAAAAEESRSKRMVLTSEDAFYLQPKLLERQLAELRPGKRGIDLYFVGVAGYSDQDVFMKEVRSVEQLFRERFDTEDRSMTLINNRMTVTEKPIASSTSLRLTLRRIGEVMDRDEDILFLFLTSHGSRDHRFSLDFWPMRFNALDPKGLREMLDASGIKRRVIVVSACYSGGFIDALKDDNSLIISASAPDKNSFGCSNEADFTYFGKAYFDEAPRQTHSFVEAFNIAAPVIADRESKNNHDKSDPRIHVGPLISPALEEFVRTRTAVATAQADSLSVASRNYQNEMARSGSGAKASGTVAMQ